MRKKLWSMSIFLLLLGAALKVNITGVSAVPTSPYIMVVPEKTVDPTLEPGMNYTISIYTDYAENDIWGWQFSLTYDPDVLHGDYINTTDTWQGDGSTKIFNATRAPVVQDSEKVYVNQVLMTKPANYTIDYSAGKITFTIVPSPGVEVKAIYLGSAVINGDLITLEKSSRAKFFAGKFDNTLGKLSLTVANFRYVNDGDNTTIDTDVTSGPGTLANVTFTVVGTGISSITLGEKTFLKGCDITTDPPTFYNIIDATMPNHIGHGYFNNVPPIHDVAVIMNYTVAIYTDYNGSNICGGQFNLTFNPAVLKGVEVRNGDLITKEKNELARFYPGQFDNTLGTLSLTIANFFYVPPQLPDVTNGPGTLAYVTFNVVGTGDLNITLGSATQLLGVNRTALPAIVYTITDAKIFITPLTALLGDIVSINVGVANEGNFTETFDVKAYVNNTLIGTQTVTNLLIGGRTLLTFNWNTTTGITVGNYIINATAELLDDKYPDDNTRATLIKIKTIHDVAILGLEIPAEGTIGELVPINVTVANQGTFEENVNLTIYYQPIMPQPPEPKVANTTNFMLAKRPTSKTIQVNWNTTGLEAHSYTINATVTIDKDEDLSDNTLLEPPLITLKLGHDVAVTAVSALPYQVFVGETVTISVTIQNVGGFNETLFEVKVTYDTKDIGSQQAPSLPAGNSTTLPFTWNTAGVDPNIYPINAEAILDTDANRDNNRYTALVVVAAPIGHIAGIVKDTSIGTPIEGATVTAGTYAATTNPYGYYKLSNVLAGNYTVTASKNGYQTSSQTSIRVVAGQTTNLNFTLTSLPTTGHITGTVTDASTGDPIEGAQVTAGGYSVSTNATGGYGIELAAGTYNVTVSANGYESSSETDVNVIAGATTTVDFKLTAVQPSNIFLYAAAGIGVIIVIAGTAVYLRKGRKTT